tara:strand:- start:1424 stop:2002 length:579 start_codon:yes stop_codon:yes gene_type:complete
MKLIISDLDFTLINGNVEKEFLIFNMLRPNDLNILPYVSFLLHFIVKKLFKTLGISFPFKLFYIHYDKPSFTNNLKRWIRSVKINDIEINETLSNKIRSSTQSIILTSCPFYIAKPFVKHVLGLPKTYVIGTDLSEFNNRLFIVKSKMYGKKKADFVSSTIKSRNIQAQGYGDSEADKFFLELCNYHEKVQF